MKRESLICLTVLEILNHDLLMTWPLVCGKAAHHGGTDGKIIHLMAGGKGEGKRKESLRFC